MKEESYNLGNHHKYDSDINDDTKENGLGRNEFFYGFDDNEDVTSNADKVDMYALNNITGNGNDVSHLLMGDNWYEDLDKYYIIPLIGFIRSSY